MSYLLTVIETVIITVIVTIIVQPIKLSQTSYIQQRDHHGFKNQTSEIEFAVQKQECRTF